MAEVREYEHLPLEQEWTPVNVREGKTEKNTNGPGNLTKFYVDFKGAAPDTDVPDVYWRRKEGNAPKVGEPILGTISNGTYGPMFQMAQRSGGGGGGGRSNAAKDAYWAAKEERDIAGIKRMGRAHAQEMALSLIAATGDAEDLVLSDSALAGQYLNEVVRKLTDWFEADVNRAG